MRFDTNGCFSKLGSRRKNDVSLNSHSDNETRGEGRFGLKVTPKHKMTRLTDHFIVKQFGTYFSYLTAISTAMSLLKSRKTGVLTHAS